MDILVASEWSLHPVTHTHTHTHTVTDNSHEADRDCPLHKPNPAEQKVNNTLIPVDTNMYTLE